MYKPNKKHLQPALISAISELPEKHLKILKGSWSESFYRDFFCKLNEDIFAVLYVSEPSRPNVPVNVLVGLEVLKAGFGWSDEELFENFCFNLQVRYALGYDRLGDGDFAIWTLYYFRERLSKHYLETGVNLLKQALRSTLRVNRLPISKSRIYKCAQGCSGWIRHKLPVTSSMLAVCNYW